MNIVKTLAITLAAAAAITAGVLMSGTLSSDLALATAGQPEAFTELYFKNLLTLPAKVNPGQAVTIRYAIANHENADMAYQPRVMLTINGVSRILPARLVFLVPDQSSTSGVTFTAPATGESIELTVSLPQQQQSIHFRTKS